MSNEAKADFMLVWSSNEAEILLKITSSATRGSEYKIKKSMENVN